MKGKVSLYYNQITIELQSNYNRVTIGCIISYILEAHSTSSSLINKKKKKKKDDKGERQNKKKRTKENEMEIDERRPEGWESRRRKQKREKREEEREKREEERKKGREEEERRKEKERKKGREEEEMRERGREKEKGESSARGVLPSANAFPSMKLGNNITPMKGRLGKNTTPISRSPTELNQNLQNNPQQRQPDFDASSRTNFGCAPEVSKCKFYSKGATIYKKAETLGNP